MKTLNSNHPSYKLHADNIAKIIVAYGDRGDRAEYLSDLYLEIVNGCKTETPDSNIKT